MTLQPKTGIGMMGLAVNHRKALDQWMRVRGQTKRKQCVTPVATSDMGSDRIPRVVEKIANGTAGTVKRARRADPLDRIKGVTKGMGDAAEIFRDSHAVMVSGCETNATSIARDRVDGAGVALLHQERVVRATTQYRRGVQAMGVTGAAVAVGVVLDGKPLWLVDRAMQWRNGCASDILLPALDRLAVEYGVA